VRLIELFEDYIVRSTGLMKNWLLAREAGGEGIWREYLKQERRS
jgi:hypothetical protein